MNIFLKCLTFSVIATMVIDNACACQGRGVGCSASIPCCAGLICVPASAPWGFCQSGGGGGGGTNTPAPTSRPGGLTTRSPAPPPPTPPPPPGSGLITKAQFVSAVTQNGYPTPTDEQYNNVISRATSSGRIADKRELAMFLANILHESDGLRAKSEYNPPPGAYVHPALDVPGQQYYGRGYIQLSWSYNYNAASLALYGDTRLLTNPNQVATNDKIAWDVSFWFWSANVHDKPGVSSGQFGATIKAINGGLECGAGASNTASPKKRFAMYQVIYKVFGIAGTPDERGCWN